MIKSIDQLMAEWAARWTGFATDGKGFLVPSTKAAQEHKLFTKGADFETKGYDPKSKLFLGGVANAKEIDRMNEVLEPTGVMVDSYLKNSVLLLYHDHRMGLGLVTSLKAEDSGVLFEAWAGDPEKGPLTKHQEEGRSLISQRILKAVSVGFIPHKIRYPTYNDRGDIVDPALIEKWEMLELSVVAVPCNAGSLFDMKQGEPQKKLFVVPAFPSLGADGRLSVSTQKNAPLEKKEMEDLKELLTKLGVSLDSIASGINALKDGQSAMQKTLDTFDAAGKGKKPDPKDPPEPDADDDEDKKAKALAETRMVAVETAVKEQGETLSSIHKTLELLVTKIKEVQAA